MTAVARNPDHLDVFAVGTDNRMYSTWWHAGQPWASWFVVSGGVSRAGSTIDVIARHPTHLDLFGFGGDSRVWSTWWDQATGWAGRFQAT